MALEKTEFHVKSKSYLNSSCSKTEAQHKFLESQNLNVKGSKNIPDRKVHLKKIKSPQGAEAYFYIDSLSFTELRLSF